MSKVTQKINKVTMTVIGIALKIIVVALICLIIVRGIRVAYDFGHSIFYETAMEEAPGTDVSVTIPEGCDAEKAADILSSKGLIENKISFRVQAAFFELEVKPGKYVFNTSQKPRQMLEAMDEGPQTEE